MVNLEEVHDHKAFIRFCKSNPNKARDYLEYLFYENQELFERLCPQFLDVQTGLIQKEQYEKVLLPKAIKEHGSKIPFSMVMFDLDDFHNFNEEYGHSIGDFAISEFVKVLKKSFRSHERRKENREPVLEETLKKSERRKDFYHFDNFGLARSNLIARVGGGEEFSVLLKSCNEENAYAAAQRAIEFTRKIQIPFQDQSLSITASAGVAQYSEGMTARELIDNADRALYNAKDKGKNQAMRYSLFLRALA